MTEEQELRQQHLIDLLRQADYFIVRKEFTNAYDAIEYARQIVMAELLSEEHAQIQRERLQSREYW